MVSLPLPSIILSRVPFFSHYFTIFFRLLLSSLFASLFYFIFIFLFFFFFFFFFSFFFFFFFFFFFSFFSLIFLFSLIIMVRALVFFNLFFAFLLSVCALPLGHTITTIALTHKQIADFSTGLRPPRPLYKVLMRRLAERHIYLSKRDLRTLGKRV